MMCRLDEETEFKAEGVRAKSMRGNGEQKTNPIWQRSLVNELHYEYIQIVMFMWAASICGGSLIQITDEQKSWRFLKGKGCCHGFRLALLQNFPGNMLKNREQQSDCNRYNFMGMAIDRFF